MDQLFPHMEMLHAMLAIPAISRKEAERADFLEEFLKGWGWKPWRKHNNILLGNPENAGLNILLNSHIDTVAPVEGWATDPFDVLTDRGKITALGSNDAGASVVCLTAAFSALARSLQGKINLMLLLSAEEEVSGKRGISSVLPGLGQLDGAIVGEPTAMQAAVAERGLMVLDGEVKGRAGHAARNEGENAIYAALKEIRKIEDLKFPESSTWLPEASAQVTMIQAGSAHNVVPDLCNFVVDVRSNDVYGNERLLELIQSSCQAILKPRSMRLKASGLQADDLLMKAVSQLKLESFGSSTMSDMALIPFPALKMGPGKSERSHTAGEYILEEEIQNGITGYCKYLETLADLS